MNEKYMKEAIRQAKKFVETNLIEEIVNNINCMEEKSNDYSKVNRCRRICSGKGI